MVSKPPSRSSDPYLASWTILARHFVAGRYVEALAVAREMLDQFPDRLAALSHAEACLLMATARVDEAVGVMQRVVDDGRWWSTRQLFDPDLRPLQSHPAYDKLAAVMREAESAARVNAVAGAAELLPLRTVGAPNCCVVVAHMAAVSGWETAEIWQPVTRAGIAVVVVESTMRNGDGRPSWDDPELAERDVRSGLGQARGFGVPVVLAGGSQGAGVAARLALGGAVADLAGFMCVVGAPWPGSWTARTAVPGLLVVGGADDLTAETQRQFAREAGELGLEVDLVEIQNLDHRYPDDWGTLAPELLARWLG